MRTPRAHRAARAIYQGLRWIGRLGRRSAVPLPPITLVTPVYNGADTIAETIESVAAQAYPHLEYVIADGGSTDGTLDIVKHYGSVITRVVSGPDKGMYDALNKGFADAKGEIFGYLNADDVLEPDALLRVADAFARSSRNRTRRPVAIYFENEVDVGNWRFPNRAQPCHVSYEDMVGGHILYQDGVFFRAEAFRAIGGFDPRLRLAGDWDFFTRLRRYGTFCAAPGHVSAFRVRAGQLSADVAAYGREQAGLQAAYLASLTVWRRLVVRGLRLARKAARRFLKPRRPLFFPFHVDLYETPLQANLAGDSGLALCPASGRPAGRLLFSTPDTRFGDERLSRFYFCDETGIATAWPRLTNADLKPLYEQHYSNAKSVIVDRTQAPSPYRAFWGGASLSKRIFILPKALPPAQSAQYARPHGEPLTTLNGAAKQWLTERLRSDWRERTSEEILRVTKGRFKRNDRSIRLLDVGCFEGALLDVLNQQTNWSLAGLELNETAGAVARSKGHRIWAASAEDAPLVVPADQRFDIITLSQVIEHLVKPREALIRLGMLLAPDGCMVISTPNLNSWQIRLFGPTWSHWHAPYHRHLFTGRGMHALLEAADLRLVRLETASHPFWSAMSVQLNGLGLTGAVSHNAKLDRATLAAGWRIYTASRLWYDRSGRGDYLIAVAQKFS